MSLPPRPGERIEVEVVRVLEGVALIDWRGVPGAIVIPELSWAPGVSDMRDHLAPGDRVGVLVIAADAERFSASIKRLHPEEDPWYDPARHAAGEVLGGVVRSSVEHGAFIHLESGAIGRIAAPDSDGLEVGQRVVVEVLWSDPEARRIELALRGDSHAP